MIATMNPRVYYSKKVLETLERNLSFHHVLLATDCKYWAKYNFPTLLKYMV